MNMTQELHKAVLFTKKNLNDIMLFDRIAFLLGFDVPNFL